MRDMPALQEKKLWPALLILLREERRCKLVFWDLTHWKQPDHNLLKQGLFLSVYT